MLAAIVALLLAGFVYAAVLPVVPPQNPSTSAQSWAVADEAVRYWVRVVEPVIPDTFGGNCEYNSAATEFGNACSTAALNCGDSTLMVCGVAAVMKRSPCTVRKKNSLSLMMGPPRVPPNWLKRSSGFLMPAPFTKKLLASNLSLRRNSQRLPCQLFVPDLVTRFTMEPALLPYSAELLLVSCWNSCTESSITSASGPPLRPLLELPFKRKPLKSWRKPLTTVFILPVLLPCSKSVPEMFTAPGVSCIRSKTLRPFNGRFAI